MLGLKCFVFVISSEGRSIIVVLFEILLRINVSIDEILE